MIIQGDCLEKLRELESNSVDAVVTDPPAGISFMSRDWDSDKGGRDQWIAWLAEIMSECKRVLKPGGHAFVWALPRTSHWTATACENAGFEIRDVAMHIFGSGFPKSHNISKAIDKAAGAEREVVGTLMAHNIKGRALMNSRTEIKHSEAIDITAPATPEAKQWDGWGTALKPAAEHWILCRKPLEKGLTIAQNVLKWGTGALNIDASRIEGKKPKTIQGGRSISGSQIGNNFEKESRRVDFDNSQGRWPSNVILGCDCEGAIHGQMCAVHLLDEMSGKLHLRGNTKETTRGGGMYGHGTFKGIGLSESGHTGASRFFYCAKSSKSERNQGLEKYERIVIGGSCKEENTVAVQLLQKVTSELMVQWLIDESGKNITAWYLKECKSTIKMQINKIIESKTLSLLIQLLINENTPDANSSLVSGGSLVESVENLKQWLLATTSGHRELALGASHVASTTLQSISDGADLQSSKEGNRPNSPDPTGKFPDHDHRTTGSNFHSTVKPVALMRYLIKLITPPGGIVLDPFTGSGTTLVACKNLGVNFIGIEQNAEYCEIARKRIEA